MPAKSRHAKGKRIAQSRKAMMHSVGEQSPSAAVQDTGVTVATGAAAPAAGIRKPGAVTSLMSYSYIPAELRLIVILSAIALVILFVLTIIYS
jgi:hypothetical protein